MDLNFKYIVVTMHIYSISFSLKCAYLQQVFSLHLDKPSETEQHRSLWIFRLVSPHQHLCNKRQSYPYKFIYCINSRFKIEGVTCIKNTKKNPMLLFGEMGRVRKCSFRNGSAWHAIYRKSDLSHVLSYIYIKKYANFIW